jgi:hypothetical protein
MATQRSTRARRPPKPRDAGPPHEPTTVTPRRSTDAPPDDDSKAELRALDEAWRSIVDTRPEDDGLTDRPLVSLLLAAVAGGPYEGAEGDPPAMAVLRTVRATVEAWLHQRSGSTVFASVSYVDLELLTRRLDVAIAVVRRSPGGIR